MKNRSLSSCFPSVARCIIALTLAGFTRGGAAAEEDDLASRILAMTGARTKIVWVHAVRGRGKGWDATDPDYELMGFDTAQAKQRVILPGPASYANPCITPDGEQVLFSDATSKTIYIVNWDGTNKREFTKGYALCTWKNPKDKTHWLYFTPGGYVKGHLMRCRIDDPDVREVLWTKEQACHTLTVSADGTRAGSEFPWPHAGVAVLPDVSWKQYGNGCNGCIAPDNSYRFFHMGESAGHAGVMMYDDGGANKREVWLDNIPGQARQHLWIPRWTTDVRFLTVNCPIGGPAAEVYLGQFDEEFTRVVRWIRITDQPGQDTKAYAWIDQGLGQYAGEVPFTVEIPADLTPGGQWSWHYGDGAGEQSVSGKHTYTKSGAYTITARKGDRLLKGWVNAQERKPPTVTAVRLLDETHMQVVFDERVQVKDAKISLQSGVPVKHFALDGEGLGVTVELGGKLGKQDTLRLEGVYDRAQVPNAAKERVAITRSAWPDSRDNLVFLWETAKGHSFQYNSNRRAFEDVTLKTWRQARQDRYGAMLFAGGAFFATDGGTGIVGECVGSDRFSIEATITPHNTYQGRAGAPRRILGCNRAGGDDVNFALGQEGDKLVLLIRAGAGRPQRVELCTLADQQPNHVVVSYAPGDLACYLNGKPARRTDEVNGKLNWGKPAFENGMNMGGREDLQFSWRGKLEGIAVFSRALDAGQAAKNFAAYARGLAGRKKAAQIEAQVRLLAKSEIPNVHDIAPYRDALVVNEYEVTEVVRGRYAPKKLRVAEWGLLNARPTAVARAKPGDTAQIVVEAFSDHPELEAEVTRDTLPQSLDLALYVDVTIRPSGKPRLAGITIKPREVWLPLNGKHQFRAVLIDQYGNPIGAKLTWSVKGGGGINVGTAYGAGHHFVERTQIGGGTIDNNGRFASTKAGVVTITAAGVQAPGVSARATVGIGGWPAINPARHVPLHIGTDNAYRMPFAGDIDRVRIYERVLTAQEIADHAAGKGLDAKDPGLVGDWTFDELKNGVYPNAAGKGMTATTDGEVEHVEDDDGTYVRVNGKGFLKVAPDQRLNMSRTCTLEAWIRPKNNSGCIMSKQAVWMWGFWFGLHDNGLEIDALRTTTGPLHARFTCPNDAWTHVAAALDVAGAWRLYANGKLLTKRDPHPLLIAP